jgi:hypothetical protein
MQLYATNISVLSYIINTYTSITIPANNLQQLQSLTLESITITSLPKDDFNTIKKSIKEIKNPHINILLWQFRHQYENNLKGDEERLKKDFIWFMITELAKRELWKLSTQPKISSPKKKTLETTIINGKKHAIYVGSRGGKYIKKKGEWIRVPRRQ